MNLEQLIEQITATPLFQKLKTVIENAAGSHDNERVYDHCLRTAANAKKEREGTFITNSKAQACFQKWMKETHFGMLNRDILVLVALVHDCGKLLMYKENTSIKPLLTKIPQTKNQVLCPGHEYWGANLVVKELLKDIAMHADLKRYIAELVSLHGTFLFYFEDKDDWTSSELVDFVKSGEKGLFKESLFNALCDIYNAPKFIKARQRIPQLFNEPALYTQRTYFIG